MTRDQSEKPNFSPNRQFVASAFASQYTSKKEQRNSLEKNIEEKKAPKTPGRDAVCPT